MVTIYGSKVITCDVWCEAMVLHGMNALSRLCIDVIEQAREHLRSFNSVLVLACQVYNCYYYWK